MDQISTADTNLALEASTWRERADRLSIASASDYQSVAVMLQGVAALSARIAEYHAPNIQRWHKGHKAALAERDEMISPLKDAERVMRDKMSGYLRAERERQEAEARQAVESARAEAQARRQQEIESILNDAAETDDDSLLEAAVDLEQAPLPTVLAPSPMPVKAAGIAATSVWDVRVVDLHALVRWLANNPAYLDIIEPSVPKLRALVRATSGRLSIPGILAEQRDSIRVRKA